MYYSFRFYIKTYSLLGH